MTTLDRMLRQAARRTALTRAVWALWVAFAVASVALIGLRVAEKGFDVGPVPWGWAWGLALACVAIGASAWVWLTRPGHEELAQQLDERCGLKATLSTALWARGERHAGGPDGWHALAMGEGDRAASRVVLRDAYPVRSPRWWWGAIVGVVAVLAAHWLPSYDVLELLDDERAERRLAQEEEERSILEVRETVEAVRDELASALVDIQDEQLDELLSERLDEIEQPLTAEELRRAEMRAMTGVRDRLAELREMSASQTEALSDIVSKLRPPSGQQTAVSALAESMQRGDFQGAREALESLRDALENEALSDEEREQHARQLEELAEQLRQAAQQQQQQQNQQNQQNQQQEPRQDASGQCQACAGGMGRLARSMRQGNAGRGEQGAMRQLDQLGQQLSQLEMLSQQAGQLGAAEAALNEQMQRLAQSNPTQGLPKILPDWATKPKPGEQGGSGIGHEGTGGSEEGSDNSLQTDLAKRAADAATRPDGPIIGSMLSEGGQQVRGESVARFKQAARAGGRAASDAIGERLIPKEYEEIVKRYFGGLEDEADAAEDEQRPREDS